MQNSSSFCGHLPHYKSPTAVLDASPYPWNQLPKILVPSFFKLSISSCSLFSWFTSYCAHQFLHSVSGSTWTAFADLGPGPDLLAFLCFSLFFMYILFLVTCARLSWWPHSAFQSTFNSRIVSYRWQYRPVH